MMGVFESEIQLIFDEIISANDSEHQEDWIAVDEKSWKNNLDQLWTKRTEYVSKSIRV